jgi:hypothetical protein
MVKYEVFTTITGLLIVFILIILTRRAKLHTSHLFWWLGVIIGISILSIYPKLVDKIGLILGIGYPPIIICILGLGAIFVKVLTMDMYITQNEIRYKQLAQKLAILEKEMQEMQKMQEIKIDD